MHVKIRVSVGDYIDRLTILEIKIINLVGEAKRKAAEEFHQLMGEEFPWNPTLDALYQELLSLNKQMWVCNEKRKAKVEARLLDEEYVNLTVEESILNDKRFLTKQRINSVTQSEYPEQKSYPWLNAKTP